MAVYLSTSDEMIPVFLSESVPMSSILKILGIKILIGILMGILIDLIFKPKNEKDAIHHMCEHDHCHCEEGIVKSSIKHTLNISIFIFVTNIILGFIFELVGKENISNLLINQKILGPVIACLIGLIPNCGASVIIAEIYVGGMIGAGTLIAGLLVGAGVGLLVLFKENHEIKENIKIVSMLYTIGLICGILLEKTGFNL